MIDPLLLLPISLIFAVFWTVSALHKLKNFPWFVSVIRDYDIFPIWMTKPLAFCVPVLELSIAATLLLNTNVGAIATVALLGFYALLLAFNGLRGRHIDDCGCSWGFNRDGATVETPMRVYVIRNLGLAIAASLICLPVTSRELLWFDWLNGLMATVSLGALGFVGVYLYSNLKKMRAVGHV